MRFLISSLIFFFCITCISAEEIPPPQDELITWNPRSPPRCSRNRGLYVAPVYCKPTKRSCIPKSYLTIGGSYTYAYIKPTSHSSTAGYLGGMQAMYEYKKINRFYGAAAVSWKQGNTERGGDRFLLQFDVQERLGYTWGSCKRARLFSLFSGFGYRRNAEKVIRNGNSVRFYYNEFYIPVGFAFKGRLSHVVSLGLNFQWMPQVFSTVAIRPLKGNYWCVNNKYANFKAGLPLTLIASQKHQISVAFEPFFEYWRDGHTHARSQAGTSLHVPGNTYLFAGIEINLGTSF